MSLPFPDPNQYKDWKEWAGAVASVIAQVQSGGGSGGIRYSAGVAPVGRDDAGNLFDLSIPRAPDLFQIDTANLAEAAVQTANLGDEAVTGAKIKDATIGTAQIGNATIVTALIGDAQIVTAKIADLAVNDAKIANLAVGSAKIADLAVERAKIADLAVDTAKINNAAIKRAKIDALAVGSAEIDNLAVTTAKINDLAVTSAKVLSLIVNKISSGTLDAAIDVGAGFFRFTVAGTMLVLGNGFGTSSQFFLWYGPSMALSACNEMSAVIYLKTNGDAYFGGSLLAGTLNNASGSSVVGTDAVATLGPFGTNGALKQYVVSYSWLHERIVNVSGGGGYSGSTSAQLALEKQNGAGWDLLTYLNVTGGVDDSSGPGTPAEPRTLSEFMDGSVSFLDGATSTADITLRARIISRNTVTFTGDSSVADVISQRINISSTEE